ncbi:hypothetical protein CERSUDRAFT_119430 [Gelatoporia subvermispora B]|uniref:Uncharacterized protein n=1 Tax=Ceriporiopsis subvermispora (strain B) TaxID=914234 RepID=M2Q4X5_CERS8|nr:hypothetical protein CERSUDRAFT_119430 [Gelatoporia subvermispora B]
MEVLRASGRTPEPRQRSNAQDRRPSASGYQIEDTISPPDDEQIPRSETWSRVVRCRTSRQMLGVAGRRWLCAQGLRRALHRPDTAGNAGNKRTNDSRAARVHRSRAAGARWAQQRAARPGRVRRRRPEQRVNAEDDVRGRSMKRPRGGSVGCEAFWRRGAGWMSSVKSGPVHANWRMPGWCVQGTRGHPEMPWPEGGHCEK